MNKPNDNRKLSMGERYADIVAENKAQPAERKQAGSKADKRYLELFGVTRIEYLEAQLEQARQERDNEREEYNIVRKQLDDARTQVADLLAELKRLVHDVRVNFPEADPFLLRGSDAAIAVAEGRQS